MKKKIVCFGPGPLFKGGISNYNTSLVKTLAQRSDVEVSVVSWTQQYPAIVPREFVDKKSKQTFLDSTIPVYYLTNYNNPFTWKVTADHIIRLKPDKVIFQWYNAQQGLPLSYIVRQIKKQCNAEIIFDLHFVVPKENSRIDTFFTRMGLVCADTFITHAGKTIQELQQLFSRETFHLTSRGERKKGQRNILSLYHPIYTLFKPDPNFDKQKVKESMGLSKYVFLFFGFIRKYKGLHHCIEAFYRLSQQRDDVSLLICGESFWQTLDETKLSVKVKKMLFALAKKIFQRKEDDESDYRPLELIQRYGLEKKVVVVNTFIPNEEVHIYFQVSDAVLLFYLTATPSGVESLSYNFGLPILATRVGHFPETIREGYNGYLADAGDIEQMAAIMQKIIEKPIPRENIYAMAKEMSWERYVEVILAC